MIKNIAYIAFFTAFVAVVWVVLTIIHNQQTSTIAQSTQVNIDPISPRFDTKTLEAIKQRTPVNADLSLPPLVQGIESQPATDPANLQPLDEEEPELPVEEEDTGDEELEE